MGCRFIELNCFPVSSFVDRILFFSSCVCVCDLFLFDRIVAIAVLILRSTPPPPSTFIVALS